MNIIRFDLKQHTPITHFQAKEDGATLRASEVKPKLDKFLFRKFSFFDVDAEGKSIVKQEYVDCIKKTGNKEFAFDYALSFIARDNVVTEIDSRHRNSPMYFGNMGDNANDHKDFVYARGGVAGKIRVKNGLLKEHLEECLEEFFWLHNFGTRQSKGYGSFTIIKLNNIEVGQNVRTRYSFQLSDLNWEAALAKIDLFYRVLRSGINIGSPKYTDAEGDNMKANIQQYLKTKFYIKPVIFCFALYKLEEQWDKKSVKEHYFNNDYYYRRATRRERDENHSEQVETLGLPIQLEDFSDSDVLTYSTNANPLHYDFRDLFGFSNDEEWYSYGAHISKKMDGVSRWKSPLTFKPIFNNRGCSVHIIINDIEGKIKGNTVTINETKLNTGIAPLELKIPDDFSFYDFFEYIRNDYDFDSQLQSKFKRYTDQNSHLNYYEVLNSIFSQLKEN